MKLCVDDCRTVGRGEERRNSRHQRTCCQMPGLLAASRWHSRGPRPHPSHLADGAACTHVVQWGAQVVSASFGGPGFSQALYDAVSQLEQAGILFVAAAGNGEDLGRVNAGGQNTASASSLGPGPPHSRTDRVAADGCSVVITTARTPAG